MRLTFLSTSGNLGGAEVSLRDVLASLRRARPAWTLVLVVPRDGRLAREALLLGVEIVVLPFPVALARVGEHGIASTGALSAVRLARAVASTPWYVYRLRAILRAPPTNVIHANGLKAHMLAAVAKPAGASLVWHMHDYLQARPLSARLLGRLAHRCDAVLANSESVARDVRGVFHDRVSVSTMYNGVDLDRFRPDGASADLDALAGLPRPRERVVRVGLVAVMARWKGHDLFLEALARLASDTVVRGYVVGGPIYDTEGSQRPLDELRASARERGLEGRVGFTGFVDTPETAMRSLDVVVHASTEPEPFGLVIAEAMACGRPVIASRAGGAVEIVEEGVDGLLFSPGDAGQLAAAIARLAADPDERRRLGDAAAQSARRFDRWAIADTLVPLYERSVHRTRR
jgi:glycosyltransferase involved in cell wall biosynthesis